MRELTRAWPRKFDLAIFTDLLNTGKLAELAQNLAWNGAVAKDLFDFYFAGRTDERTDENSHDPCLHSYGEPFMDKAFGARAAWPAGCLGGRRQVTQVM